MHCMYIYVNIYIDSKIMSSNGICIGILIFILVVVVVYVVVMFELYKQQQFIFAPYTPPPPPITANPFFPLKAVHPLTQEQINQRNAIIMASIGAAP